MSSCDEVSRLMKSGSTVEVLMKAQAKLKNTPLETPKKKFRLKCLRANSLSASDWLAIGVSPSATS
jgi:hypothetical protein